MVTILSYNLSYHYHITLQVIIIIIHDTIYHYYYLLDMQYGT